MTTLSSTLDQISKLEADVTCLKNSIKYIDNDNLTSDVLDIVKDIVQLTLEIAALYNWIKKFA